MCLIQYEECTHKWRSKAYMKESWWEWKRKTQKQIDLIPNADITWHTQTYSNIIWSGKLFDIECYNIILLHSCRWVLQTVTIVLIQIPRTFIHRFGVKYDLISEKQCENSLSQRILHWKTTDVMLTVHGTCVPILVSVYFKNWWLVQFCARNFI